MLEFAGVSGGFETVCPLNRKIGILGGTFNPCHLGHIFIARFVREEFSLDQVLLIPAGDPPHKPNSALAHKEHRFAMCELSARDYPHIAVSRIEIDRPGTTYTVDTLETLKRALPSSCEIYFIIGSDTLCELTTWRRYQRIIELCEFICVLRRGDDMSRVSAQFGFFEKNYKKEIFLSMAFTPDISSTDIRQRIGRGESVSALVLPGVEEYIYENGVYK